MMNVGRFAKNSFCFGCIYFALYIIYIISAGRANLNFPSLSFLVASFTFANILYDVNENDGAVNLIVSRERYLDRDAAVRK